MKFNLKNTPKLQTDAVLDDDNDEHAFDYYDQQEIDAWFEGFEKELWEILKNHKPHPSVASMIEEILGQ